MVKTAILFMTLAWSAPPTIPAAKPITAPKAVAAPKAATVQKAKSTTMPARVAANPAMRRVAQLPPLPELPPAPQPGLKSPQPVPPPPQLDPFEAPLLPHGEGGAPLLPPPPGVDHGYHAPVVAHPLGDVPPAPLEPAFDGGFAEAGYGPGCADCYGCPCEDDDDGCCLCGPDCPCDLYPHYAYFPKYHGHYYFRPYNYTTVFEQQRWASDAGLDPRNPYSNKIFDCVFAGYEQLFRVDTGPIGSALPVGNTLPQLEDLLDK